MRWAQLAALQLLISFSFHSRVFVDAKAAETCDATTYGKPLSSDCTALFQRFTVAQDLRTRLFDEEQLREELDLSWPGVENTFVPSIVQVPKYFSKST